MKKRYLILAGLLVMTVAAAGCGKKKTTETAPVEVTATPTPEVTKAVDMVDMQQTADEDIKNVMGEKTSTASKIVFVNNTGDDIQSLYIRTHVDEDSEDYDAVHRHQVHRHQIHRHQIRRQHPTRVQLPMISVLHILMRTRMNAFSAIFRLEQFRRLRYVWMAQMMMRSHMQNI